jgi:hypothetical protein
MCNTDPIHMVMSPTVLAMAKLTAATVHPSYLSNYEQRPVYVPIAGAHMGAIGESLLPDGRSITLYELSDSYYELSISESANASSKTAFWEYTNALAVFDALCFWDGEGEAPGASRRRS